MFRIRFFHLYVVLFVVFISQISIGAFAQDGIALIDSERLFVGSDFGKAFNILTKDKSLKLASKTKNTVAELTREELELSELRKTEDPKVFKELAYNFDLKVKEKRSLQEQELAQLENSIFVVRENFNKKIEPILQEIMIMRGISILLNKNNVLMSSSHADITDDVIELINKELK